jgi:hypothetical protein
MTIDLFFFLILELFHSSTMKFTIKALNSIIIKMKSFPNY